MKKTRFVCTHCGRRFEAEEKENLECPGCFWSTTVKKEEDALPEVKLPVAEEPPARKGNPFAALNASFLKPVLVLLVVIVILGAIIFVVWFRVRGGSALTDKGGIAIEVPIKAEQKSKAGRAKVSSKTSEGLSQEEKNILERKVSVSTDRPVSEEEQKILSTPATLKTGIVEKLPSKSWTLENFRQMIAEQERFYKIPLPHSYKGKLEKLFTEKYLPAQTAFEAGKLSEARNLWVEALAFPIYGSDLAKHRGVVLTMIRPFINDTLAKIGILNSTLTEVRVRDQETAAVKSYAEFLDLIRKKMWSEAAAVIPILEKILDGLENPGQLTTAPAPYPVAINQVDEGIRRVLLEMLQQGTPAVANIEPLRVDIQAKKKVVESFIPGNLEAVQVHYEAAMTKIAAHQWAEAEKELRQIEGPLALAEDAKTKIEILKKLQKGS